MTTPDSPDHMMELIEERRQWEAEALKTPVPNEITCIEDMLAGVRCLWICECDAVDAVDTSNTEASSAETSNSKKDKAVVFLHGGGLTSGSPVTHRSLAARLTKFLHIPFLLINYRLLPENPYPAPLHDVLAVYDHLLKERHYLPENLIFTGDSTGAGLALAAMVQLRDTGAELPSAAIAISGAFDATLSGESMLNNDGKDPMLSYAELTQWRDNYLYNPGSPSQSPLFAELHGLPPVLLLAGGQDLWLSDSERIAEKLNKCGGTVDLRVWENMGHTWLMDSNLAETKNAMEEIARFIGTIHHGK